MKEYLIIHEIEDLPLGYMYEYKEQIPADAWYAPFVFDINSDYAIYELYIPAGSIVQGKN